MDKQQKRAHKQQYKAAQAATSVSTLFQVDMHACIQQVTIIRMEQLAQWSDDEVEQQIIYYVYHAFKQAGRCPKGTNRQAWERATLLRLPPGLQAVYATNLFEGSLSLNASYWDFFYQSGGTYALEVLQGYHLMGNTAMVIVLEQCIGAYLKMHYSGEIEELMGEEHTWEIDEAYFIDRNEQNFDELDAAYQAVQRELLAKLRAQKIAFIRQHPNLFLTESSTSG
jgi:hypothetical protein